MRQNSCYCARVNKGTMTFYLMITDLFAPCSGALLVVCVGVRSLRTPT